MRSAVDPNAVIQDTWGPRLTFASAGVIGRTCPRSKQAFRAGTISAALIQVRDYHFQHTSPQQTGLCCGHRHFRDGEILNSGWYCPVARQRRSRLMSHQSHRLNLQD